mmetsp:Transcript_59172/g.138476  ORF Transcript_59172/g.138476 Transcript_59172/m.138476 type:complete len:240 (-) Transcript_59172:736-1455(-)
MRHVHLNLDIFPRFQDCPILTLLLHNTWWRKRHLVAFSPHFLDEDSELHLATATNFEVVAIGRLLDLNRGIGKCLLFQALAHGVQGDVLAIFARQRRVVDGGSNSNHRGIYRLAFHRRHFWMAHKGLSPSRGEARNAHGDDVPSLGHLHGLPAHAVNHRDLAHLAGPHDLPVQALAADLVALVDLTAVHLSRDGWPQRRKPVELRHQHCKSLALLVELQDRRIRCGRLGWRHDISNGLV